MRLISTVVVFALWAGLAMAQDPGVARYDVRFLGANVGTLNVSGAETQGRYSARAHFATRGVVEVVKKMRFNLAADGRVNGARLMPAHYAEDIDNGRRVTRMTIEFRNGVATRVTGDPGSKAKPVDPATLPGALDPMSVFYAATRDQPAGTACKMKVDVYDGHRHATLRLNKGRATAKGLSCSGVYRRVAGYTKKEKSRGPIPITVEYARVGDMMRAMRISATTNYGKAVLHRR